MPVGPVTGETVDNLLISSVAANTQAHETTAVHQPALLTLFDLQLFKVLNFMKAMII